MLRTDGDGTKELVDWLPFSKLVSIAQSLCMSNAFSGDNDSGENFSLKSYKKSGEYQSLKSDKLNKPVPLVFRAWQSLCHLYCCPKCFWRVELIEAEVACCELNKSSQPPSQQKFAFCGMVWSTHPLPSQFVDYSMVAVEIVHLFKIYLIFISALF